MDTDSHDELVARLQYFEGHSDTLGLFADARFLARAATAVADPFRGAAVTKVAGIEARGFVLATAVALELDAGFVAIRKPGAIHPGPKAELTAPRDVGLSLLVDQLPAELREELAPTASVALAEELRDASPAGSE